MRFDIKEDGKRILMVCVVSRIIRQEYKVNFFPIKRNPI